MEESSANAVVHHSQGMKIQDLESGRFNVLTFLHCNFVYFNMPLTLYVHIIIIEGTVRLAVQHTLSLHKVGKSSLCSCKPMLDRKSKLLGP